MKNTIARVAAVHAAPVFLDKSATVEKAISLLQEAARNGAKLVAFPESYIPAFPIWAALWAPIHNHELFELMVKNSLRIDGPEIARFMSEARRLDVCVSLGITEGSDTSVGLLWNSNVLIGNDGRILNHHRKLVPTFYEKLIWAAGDGAGLRVSETQAGKVGMLICGENTNPLARYSLMAQGEQIHISTWPAMWPTRPPCETGNYDNLAANHIRASAHAFEAKCFGIVCAGFFDKRMRDFLVKRDANVAGIVDNTPRAASFFVDPTGATMGERAHDDEALIYAEFNLDRCIEPKQFHDVVGYYNRFDVFTLNVRRQRQTPITLTDITNCSPAVVPSTESVVAIGTEAALD